jgi:peptidoglycan DL-endopeptidase CwlO
LIVLHRVGRHSRSRRLGALAVLCAAALTVVVVAVAPVHSAQAADYPTWSEVQKAKSNAKAKAAEVKKIQGVLSSLQQKAEQLGQAAIVAAAKAQRADDELKSAQAKLTVLQKQVAAATKRAKTARHSAGLVATQLYRGGDPTLSIWLSGEKSGSLLSKLGLLSQLGTSSANLLRQATADQRVAAALDGQAKVQQSIRNSLAKTAEKASAQAKAAQTAADEEVAKTKAETATLQSQLKTLNATYSSEKASYAQEQKLKAEAAARGASSGAGGSLGSIAAGPGSLSPAGAQAYASGRMSAYGWSGSQFSCLVALWNIESGWRWDAYNASSGAYGIPQSLPGSKMASSGGDWSTSSATQINWGLGYIADRYGTPCGAYDFETSHVPYWY